MNRWADRVMVAACGLVLALVGTVWAVTWGATKADVQDNTEEIRAIQQCIKYHGERIMFMEASQEENKRRLERMEKKQDVIDEKVNLILLRVDK